MPNNYYRAAGECGSSRVWKELSLSAIESAYPGFCVFEMEKMECFRWRDSLTA